MARSAITFITLAVGLVGHPVTGGSGEGFKIEEGFVSLFNGKDLSGWRYGKEKLDAKTESGDKRFGVEDGVIVARVGSGIRDLYTAKDFPGNFHVKLEFRASLKADSGVYLRGHQLQVRDYIRRSERKLLKKFKNDDWNELDLILTNGVVTTTVNGQKLTSKDSLTVKLANGQPVVELNGKPVQPNNIQITTMAVAKCYCNGEYLEDLPVQNKSGGIGLQAESGKFEFRRIRVKELP